MDGESKMTTGAVTPSRSALNRPKNRSIDTPALKIDTSSVGSGSQISISGFPPPPRSKTLLQARTGAAKAKTSNASATATTEALPHNINGETTPVMKSMFPRLAPVSKFSKQANAPSSAQNLPITSVRQAPYTPSLYSQPRSPPAAVIAADPWEASRVPSRQYRHSHLCVIEVEPTNLSSAEELLDLWTLALGQESPEALPRYTLGLKCNSLKRNQESISLVSSSADFYTATAHESSLTITRKHPVNSQNGITILEPRFETPTTTSPTVASLFPSTAENQALNLARQIATDNQLSEHDSAALQSEAVLRARHTEAGAILWDSDSSSFFFSIPDVKNPPEERTTSTALPIEHVPGEHIRFLDGSSQPLLTLSLAENTVVVETNAISTLTASLHTLDILLSGLLTLVLYLHRQQGVFSEPRMVAPHFAPPPTSVRSGHGRFISYSSSPKQNHKKHSAPSKSWLSRFKSSATRTKSQFPRSNDFADDTDSTLTFEKDLERGMDIDSVVMSSHRIPPMTTPPIARSGIAPELRGSNTGVDLSRFQAFDLEDPELGSGTKIALRFLYWAFSVMVWILGVIIGVMAAGIVAVGGCLGGGSGSREG